MISDKIKEKFLTEKIKQESIPHLFVEQSIKFPIYSFDLTGEIDSEEIVTNIETLIDSNNKKPMLVIDGYQSNYFDRDEIDTLYNLIIAVEKRASVLSGRELRVKKFWFVILNNKGKHKMHNHCNGPEVFCDNLLSGVYYPTSIEDSPIVFTNDNQKLSIKAKRNELILFDSRLTHGVPEAHNVEHNRISVAFNITW